MQSEVQPGEEFILTDTEFFKLRQLVYRWTGIALNDGKRQLLKSRLQRRLRHHRLSSYQAYYDYLMQLEPDNPEIGEFINCVTTNKTDFFREPHHFDFIAREFVPECVRQAQQGLLPQRLRIWHAGCSTGEEPYTLAITLAEALAPHPGWEARQLASDIDTAVLAHAERGIYALDRVAPVPEPLLKRYFLRGAGPNNGQVRVCRELRERITFRQINLLADTWPIRSDARFDLIFCRNVVIYFDKPTQKTLFARFAQWLRPGGYLFIGHSESLLGISDAFTSVGKTIYRLPETAAKKARAA